MRKLFFINVLLLLSVQSYSHDTCVTVSISDVVCPDPIVCPVCPEIPDPIVCPPPIVCPEPPIEPEPTEPKLLYSQGFEDNNWQGDFTGYEVWKDKLKAVTNNPKSGERSLRGNQLPDVTDPITNTKGMGNYLLDWRGKGRDLETKAPDELYFSYWVRHDDYNHVLEDDGSGEGKLMYIVDEKYNVGAMYLNNQLAHSSTLKLRYSNGNYNDAWAYKNWGYGYAVLSNPNVVGGTRGKWRKFEYYINYKEHYIKIWVDGHIMKDKKHDDPAFPFLTTDGKTYYDTELDLKTIGFQFFWTRVTNINTSTDREGYAAGWQIDDLQVWDGMPPVNPEPPVEPPTTAKKPVLPLQLDLSNPLTDGLIGAYRVNENTEGVWVDVSGKSSDGVISGAELVYVDSVNKYALVFDGDNDWIDIASNAFNVSDLSISSRIKSSTSNDAIRLFASPASYSSSNQHLVISTGGKLGVSNIVSEDITGHSTSIVNKWFSFTAMPKLGKILHDGISSNTKVAGSHSKTGTKFRIGAKQDNSKDWSGLMKYAYFHNRHLTQEEADSLAENPDQIFILEEGEETDNPSDIELEASHGDIVNYIVPEIYPRDIIDYNFAGGSLGIIENKEEGTKFQNMGAPWKFGEETRYTNNASHSYSKVDPIRGKVVFSHAHPAEEPTRYNAAISAFINDVPENTKFRFSYWTKANELDRDLDSWWQWKMTRLNNRDDPTVAGKPDHFYPDFAMFNRIRNSDLIDYNPMSYDTGKSYWINVTDVNDTWFKLTYEIYTGTKGNEDGKFRIYITDKNGTKLIGSGSSPYGSWPNNMMVYGSDYKINRILIQNYIGNSSQEVEFSTDDMHYQTGSWATVVLTNNANYTLSTIMEDQDVKSWDWQGATDTSISYVLNKGALNSGVAYEHTKDNNGNVIFTRRIELK